jgi:hypothetical protein
LHGGRLGLRRRIDPAGMDAPAQAIGHLGVDRSEAHQATKSRLDMATGATEPVIKIEVAECGVEVVAPHQNNNASAEPNAFGVSGRAVNGLRGFHEFIGFALIVLGGIGGGGGICRFGRLILGAKVATLGNRASNPDQKCKPGDGEVAQNRTFKLRHPTTHKFPDLFLVLGNPGRVV